jgi:cytochrome c biogenesis protein CcmG/thiol:disulfide interchange protein DsbE
MRRLLAIAPALAFVLLILAFVVGLRHDPSLLPSMLIGKPLPQMALAPVREGDVGLTNADLVGEPSLVNVFGSWCVSCRIEHPFLLSLRAQGVRVHGVDWKDAPADGAAWLNQFGDPYARVGNDQAGRTAIDLGVTGAPETFIVDRRGRVRYKQIGPITQEVWDEKIGPLMDRLRDES